MPISNLSRHYNKEGIYVSIFTTLIKLLIIVSFAVLIARENWRYQSAVNRQVFVKHIYCRETVLKTFISEVTSQYLLHACLGDLNFNVT